jgi:hypothetical protein
MKKLLLLCCIIFTNITASMNKPALFKDVEESGFGKAVDAGNFEAALEAFNTNKVSGFRLRKNAIEYLYMTVDIANLDAVNQGKILAIILPTPESLSSGLSITPSNHKWLMSVAPEYARRTRIVQGPVAPRIPPPAPQPSVPPAPSLSTDPTQINIHGMPGINYHDIINAWNSGEWEITVRKLEILHNNVPKMVNVFALQALLKLLIENISYEVWAKIDADPRARLARLANQYKIKVPQAPIAGPGPVVAPPDIQGQPAYSYEAAKKAWKSGRWSIVLSNLQNFESNPGVFTDKPMGNILTEMVRDTSSAEWNKIRPNIRHSLETFLKQYAVNPPVKPPLPKTPTVDDARAAWTRQTRGGQADSAGLAEALIILEALAKKDPNNTAFKAAVAELVKYADSAYWSNLTPDQPKRIKALAQIARVDEKPLPPIPGPKPPTPLPPTPQKPPAPKPGSLPPLPIEALYQKMDVAIKADNVRGALEIIIKEAQPDEIKRALTRVLIEVHPKKLLAQKELLRSLLSGLSAADQDELIRTFEATITGPDVQPLATFLRTGALPVAPPLPPIPGPKPATPLPPTPLRPSSPPLGPLPPAPALVPAAASDAKAIKDALAQDFDEAVETLHTVVATNSADFRTAVNNLFTKTKLGFKNEHERDSVLALVKKAYPDKDAREKFYGSISRGLSVALQKAEEEEDEDSDVEEPYYSPTSSRVPTPVPHPMPSPQPEKPKLPQPSQPPLPSSISAQDARNLKAAGAADFDAALTLLNKVIVNDSDEFRAALADLFSKKKERITDDQASIIWKLISRAFSDDNEHNKFLGTLPAHIQEAVKKESW